MGKLSLILPIMFLSIGLFGCQQDNAELNPDNNKEKQDEVTSNKATDDNFEVIGIITEVNQEKKSVLLDLSKKVQEDEKQMWVTIGENTKISNEIEELNFENLKPKVEIKVNLSGKCADPKIRICGAEEVVIK
ncbi:MAG: hypothetical protein KBT36_12460 [Kurthia sp.]|nr:hypothetical protein [Candidatus Kurthia equi]